MTDEAYSPTEAQIVKSSVAGLSPLEKTGLLTLYARVLDSRSPQPILGDVLADEISRGIDYEFGTLPLPPSVRYPVALRAKLLDERVRMFVAQHPNAVVVDVGAGLSTGYRRTQPPAGVDWYNIDLPAMTSLRLELLPDAECEHSVATRSGDMGWINAIPTDRPAIVIADGLTGFLSQPSIIDLLRTVTDHFRTGIVAFNDYGVVGRATRMAVKIAPQRFGAFTPTNPGFADARTPELWNSRLKLLTETRLADSPDVQLFPEPLRTGVRLTGRIPALARKWRVLSYQF